MNIRRIIWAGLTLFVIALFTIIMPVHVYDKHPIMYALFGLVLLVITLGQTLADFDSIYDLLEKDENVPQSDGRKIAPFAVIPGLIFAGVLIFYNGGRKDDELKEFGVLTKGVVTNGSSTTTTRRFQKNTTYDLIIAYQDSLGRKYQFEESVSGSEFSDAYQGQQVDVVYSRKNPDLAEAVLNLKELSQFTTVADNLIQVQHLIAILESHKPDTIVNFLNTINYQWTQSADDVYSNEKRDLAIKVFSGNRELAYMDNSSDQNLGMVMEARSTKNGTKKRSFEESLEVFGFKKKAITEGDKTQELYYTDTYGVTKENKMVESGGIGFTMITIYHVFVLENSN